MSFDEFVPPWNTYPNQDIDYFYNLKKFPWAPFQLMMSPQRQLPQISVACSVRACSVMSDYVTAWTVARQTPLSMEFSRQEYWSGCLFLSFIYMELQYVFFSVWLLSLNKLLLRFVHMGVYLRHLFFFLRSMSPLSGFITFIQSPVSEHVSCF